MEIKISQNEVINIFSMDSISTQLTELSIKLMWINNKQRKIQ